MTLSHTLLVVSGKALVNILCRIENDQLDRVPERGPLILATNHVNLLEFPVFYTGIQPRPVRGLVAAKRWNHTWSRWLLNTCNAIPLNRRRADGAAMNRALNALDTGQILAIAPEGTRSGDGCLRKGHAGVVLLALHSGAPVLPLVYYGGENYIENIKNLRRTDFHIRVGTPFFIEADGITVNRQVRHQMTIEVMYRLAVLLPPEYRGVYSDIENATQEYLVLVRNP